MDKKADNGSSQIISKFFMILEYMSMSKKPVLLQEISSSLKIPQTTMQRYLNSMVSKGYVYRNDETFRYALSWKICKIGRILDTPLSAKDIVSPYVNALARENNFGSAAMIADGIEGIYLDLVDNPATLLASLAHIGSCPPLHSSASGKILLSRYTKDELAEFIAVKGLDKVTDFTIDNPEKLADELSAVRKQGYATEIEECSLGIECIAVPVYDYKDNIYMALCVFDKSHIATTKSFRDAIVAQLKKYAYEISRKLGCSDAKLKSYL